MPDDCVLDSDDLTVLSDTDDRKANCSFGKGTTLRFFYEGDSDPLSSVPKSSALKSPAQSKDKNMKPILPYLSAPANAQDAEHHEASAAEPVAAPLAEAPAAVEEHHEAPATHATTEVPDAPNAAPDLSQIQGLAGGNPIVTVILALIVVGGGTAGWKFWNQKSKQNHELKLQELEVQKELAGLNGAQPPPCQAASVKLNADLESIRGDLRSNSDAHKKLQEQIDDLEAQLKKFEKKASSMLSGDFDAEDVVERLEKLEKAAAKEAKEKKAKK